MKKTNKAYILYEYDQFNDDFKQVMEYYNIKELKEQNKDILNIKESTNIYKYISKSIEDIKEKINNKYIIIMEDISI